MKNLGAFLFGVTLFCSLTLWAGVEDVLPIPAPSSCQKWLRLEGVRPPGFQGYAAGTLQDFFKLDPGQIVIALNDHRGWMSNADFDPGKPSSQAENPRYYYDSRFQFFPKAGDYLVVFHPDGTIVFQGVLSPSQSDSLADVKKSDLAWLLGEDKVGTLQGHLFADGLSAILFPK